jgi:hypothetical protein
MCCDWCGVQRSVPPALKALLESRSHLKAGVGCAHDASKLSADYAPLHVRGTIELASACQRSPLHQCTYGAGLKTMTQV